MSDFVKYEPIEYTRTNILVKIPLSLSTRGLRVFLDGFQIDDLADIFCMVEFLAFRFKRRKLRNKPLRDSLKYLIDIFIKLEEETYFRELLKNSNVESSSGRIAKGQGLVLPIYR